LLAIAFCCCVDISAVGGEEYQTNNSLQAQEGRMGRNGSGDMKNMLQIVGLTNFAKDAEGERLIQY
jgi:hypothetical protein